jgi:asparagine synthase (glutamine-hydrolysing)
MLEVAGLPFEERFQRWCSFFPNAENELLLSNGSNESRQTAAEHFQRHFRTAADATPLARLLFLNFNTYLPEDLLVKMDRSTMANGLEARSPFLDTELVEFAGRLPDGLKLRGLTTKYLLREAFKDLIPSEILHRGKMGFGVPLGAWFRGPLRSYLTEHLSGTKPRLFDLVKRDTVASHLETHMAEKADYGQRLFCLLTLEIWLRSL